MTKNAVHIIEKNKGDIETIADIKLLVDSFYDKVRADVLLSKVFEDIIKDRWPSHLEKMYRFWQTVLLNEHTYFGSPFLPHAHLPVESRHFGRWLYLFTETLQEHFAGPRADRALWQADRMAVMFQSKMEFIRENKSHPLL